MADFSLYSRRLSSMAVVVVEKGERALLPLGCGGDEGLGRQVELPLRKRFLTEKSHGSLNLDRNCPSLSAFLLGHTKARERVAEKPKTRQRCHCCTDGCKNRLEGLILLSISHPCPVLFTPPLSILIALFCGEKACHRYHISQQQVSACGASLCLPASFANLYLYWRLINKHQIS